jgi:uncharacterized OB-fold protein
MSKRPLPEADFLTESYWEGAKKEQLLIQRCESCNHWNHPPKARCPKCGSRHLTTQPAPLKGEVYTYSITRKSRISGFENIGSYAVAIVKLEDLPVKIVLNVVDCQPEDVHIGMQVDIIFEQVDDIFLPQAKPRTI